MSNPETTGPSEAWNEVSRAMEEVRKAFPMTIEFEDGTTMVIRSLRDVPRGKKFRTLLDGEWGVVESL